MSDQIHVFAVAGQSNAAGHGAGGQWSPLPDPARCLQHAGGSTLLPAHDPVGTPGGVPAGATGATAWPAFCETYLAATGCAVLVVPCAVGGTGQYAASDTGNGHWGAGGTLVDAALTRIGQALVAAQAVGVPVWKGVLWHQGENDSDKLQGDSADNADYRAALRGMIGRFRTAFGGRFYCVRTGGIALGAAGYQRVREAQELAVQDEARGGAVMVYRGCAYYKDNGLMLSGAGERHYRPRGYQLMGRWSALGVVHNGPPGRTVTGEAMYGASLPDRLRFTTD